MTAEREGTVLGVVEDVLVDREARRATGVILGRGVHEALAVRFSDLAASFDPRLRLSVSGAESAVLLSRLFPRGDAVSSGELIGTQALSDRGTLLGVVQDLILDLGTGDINALDVIGEPRDTDATVSVDAVLRFGSEYTLVAEDRWMEETRA